MGRHPAGDRGAAANAARPATTALLNASGSSSTCASMKRIPARMYDRQVREVIGGGLGDGHHLGVGLEVTCEFIECIGDVQERGQRHDFEVTSGPGVVDQRNDRLQRLLQPRFSVCLQR